MNYPEVDGLDIEKKRAENNDRDVFGQDHITKNMSVKTVCSQPDTTNLVHGLISNNRTQHGINKQQSLDELNCIQANQTMCDDKTQDLRDIKNTRMLSPHCDHLFSHKSLNPSTNQITDNDENKTYSGLNKQEYWSNQVYSDSVGVYMSSDLTKTDNPTSDGHHIACHENVSEPISFSLKRSSCLIEETNIKSKRIKKNPATFKHVSSSEVNVSMDKVQESQDIVVVVQLDHKVERNSFFKKLQELSIEDNHETIIQDIHVSEEVESDNEDFSIETRSYFTPLRTLEFEQELDELVLLCGEGFIVPHVKKTASHLMVCISNLNEETVNKTTIEEENQELDDRSRDGVEGRTVLPVTQFVNQSSNEMQVTRSPEMSLLEKRAREIVENVFSEILVEEESVNDLSQEMDISRDEEAKRPKNGVNSGETDGRGLSPTMLDTIATIDDTMETVNHIMESIHLPAQAVQPEVVKTYVDNDRINIDSNNNDIVDHVKNDNNIIDDDNGLAFDQLEKQLHQTIAELECITEEQEDEIFHETRNDSIEISSPQILFDLHKETEKTEEEIRNEEKEHRIRSFELLLHLETIIKEIEVYRGIQNRLQESFKHCMVGVMRALSSMTHAIQTMEKKMDEKIKEAHDHIQRCHGNLESSGFQGNPTKSQYEDLKARVKNVETLFKALSVREIKERAANQVSAEINGISRRMRVSESNINELKLRVTELEAECSLLKDITPVGRPDANEHFVNYHNRREETRGKRESQTFDFD